MRNTLDDFVHHIEEQIYQETREAYGEIAFQRWLNPLFMGSMENPDGYASLRGVCGDTMEIFLKFERSRVKDASFRSSGCGSSSVCASFAAELSVGKTPDDLLGVTAETIMEKLGGLPKEDEHLAYLAAETLRQAVNDYSLKKARGSE